DGLGDGVGDATAFISRDRHAANDSERPFPAFGDGHEAKGFEVFLAALDPIGRALHGVLFRNAFVSRDLTASRDGTGGFGTVVIGQDTGVSRGPEASESAQQQSQAKSDADHIELLGMHEVVIGAKSYTLVTSRNWLATGQNSAGSETPPKPTD